MTGEVAGRVWNVNTFVDLLEQEGIYCTVSGPFDVHVPKMRLPDEPEE